MSVINSVIIYPNVENITLHFSSNILTGLVGVILLIGGAIYRYKIKKYRPNDTGNVLNLIGISFVTSLAILYMLGSIDFFFNEAAILDFGVDDLKIAALVGSLIFGYLAFDRFIRFLRNKGRNENE